MSTLDDAIQAIRMGDKEEGRQILEELLETDESNEQVWLWLSTIVDTNEDREVCLENVLALNPDNTVAQKAMNDLRTGRFNAHELMSAALSGIEEDEEPVSGATFIDEFRRASEEEEEEDDDELVLPSTMARSKAQKKQAAKKKGGSGFKLNPRLIILAVLALVVICGLASMVTYNLFLSDSPSGEQTIQETPAGSDEVPPPQAPTPAESTPAPPTDTPTPTRVPLLLPTSRPTDPPTPTATQVVAPTP